ncbi:hypothetical protein Echvi_3402 [Echinicola vietnamensis DSM 17526]|uniref:Uncharacterized protein n=1 Tax=Echinicola vietnamensis (strain DSM 17526 / LMG 23754 / KMM 6221) TaxID=926556 RepID=L0G270_ECHVK|nr:hypothetical protein Echvi_3402 [Echinicola vietnamensis DSM 17526]
MINNYITSFFNYIKIHSTTNHNNYYIIQISIQCLQTPILMYFIYSKTY